MRLVDGEQGRPNVHGGIAQQGEKSGRVEEKLLGQPVGAHALENQVVGGEGFQVDAGREGVVHALLKPLADDDAAGNDGVLLVGQ